MKLLTTTTIAPADVTRAAAAEETEIGDHETVTGTVSETEPETMIVTAIGETAVTVETETVETTVAVVEKDDAVAGIMDARPRRQN